MARSKSSKKWLEEHFADPYVKRAQQEGWRSRAAYKLLEINKKFNLFKPGMRVVDLGAAPGGWSQVVAKLIAPTGIVYALDILSFEPLPGVEFIQGDFTEEKVEKQLLQLVNNKIDIVISDMSPNISGVRVADQTRAIYLAELALDFACKILIKNGIFLVKTFQGEGFDGFLQQLHAKFKKVQTYKPAASRPRSRELFLLAKGFKCL